MTQSIRLYFSDISIAEKIDFQGLTLLNKTGFTRILSGEGIFHMKDNKLLRVHIKDQPTENINIQNINFLVDKSSIKYDVDWYQINPYHIIEHIDVYTYALSPHTVPDNNVQLILERQDKQLNTLYFNVETDDFNNSIDTFLSGLNLC